MSNLLKSPRHVARRALAVGHGALRCYAHKYSPKKYTQPPFFACLVLKALSTPDYRGIVVSPQAPPALAGYLGLRPVPHWTPLHKAAGRLLRRRRVRRLLRGTVRRFLGRRRRVRRAAL